MQVIINLMLFVCGVLITIIGIQLMYIRRKKGLKDIKNTIKVCVVLVIGVYLVVSGFLFQREHEFQKKIRYVAATEVLEFRIARAEGKLTNEELVNVGNKIMFSNALHQSKFSSSIDGYTYEVNGPIERIYLNTKGDGILIYDSTETNLIPLKYCWSYVSNSMEKEIRLETLVNYYKAKDLESHFAAIKGNETGMIIEE